jgi:hypothetical protein
MICPEPCSRITEIAARVTLRTPKNLGLDLREAPEGGDGRGDGIARRSGIGDVEGECSNAIAEPRNETFQLGRVPGGSQQLVACRKRGLRERAAEPPGTASD